VERSALETGLNRRLHFDYDRHGLAALTRLTNSSKRGSFGGEADFEAETRRKLDTMSHPGRNRLRPAAPGIKSAVGRLLSMNGRKGHAV